MEELVKLLFVFVLGVIVIIIGLIFSFLEVVLLGGLLSGISGFIMLIRMAAQWK
ncbi:MAG: hypothetical protein ACQ9CV_07080 [Nitrosopumilus sp.]|jgi:hypothetical protein